MQQDERNEVSVEREPSVSALVRRLADDMKRLVHDEIALAKVEGRQMAATLLPQGAKVVTAAGLAFSGWLALIAFAVIGLGVLLGGLYWLSALIVGVLCAAAGGLLLQGALHRIARLRLTLHETGSAVRESVGWAQEEIKDIPVKLASGGRE